MSNKVKRKSKDAKTIKERRIIKDSTEKTADLFVAVGCIVLHDKFGFGKVRLERFMQELLNLTDSIKKGYCSVNDLFGTLKEETGIDFSRF